jgi:hypothetical protein
MLPCTCIIFLLTRSGMTSTCFFFLLTRLCTRVLFVSSYFSFLQDLVKWINIFISNTGCCIVYWLQRATKGVFGCAVDFWKSAVQNLLWKSCCELTTVRKLKVVWLEQLLTADFVENNIIFLKTWVVAYTLINRRMPTCTVIYMQMTILGRIFYLTKIFRPASILTNTLHAISKP